MTAKTFIKTIVLEGIHKPNFRPQNNCNTAYGQEKCETRTKGKFW